eukprot:scaffold86_cov338-Pavlova_lutheri.AAC.5
MSWRSYLDPLSGFGGERTFSSLVRPDLNPIVAEEKEDLPRSDSDTRGGRWWQVLTRVARKRSRVPPLDTGCVVGEDGGVRDDRRSAPIIRRCRELAHG